MFGGIAARASSPASGVGVEPQPAPAVAAGYNTLVLFDHFTGLGSIDVNNTRNAGYLWYVGMGDSGNGTPYKTYPASAITQSGSTITLTNPNQDQIYYGLFTALYNFSSPYSKIVGKDFTGGFYAEARLSFDPTLNVLTPGGVNWDPGWAISYFPGFFGVPQIFPFTELDFFEGEPFTYAGGPASPPTTVFAVNYFTDSTHSQTAPGFVYATAPDANMHTYGTQWIPMSKGGGTGTVKRYVDGVHKPANDFSYTSSSSPNWGLLDGQTTGQAMVFYSGWKAPITIDYVQVWQ